MIKLFHAALSYMMPENEAFARAGILFASKVKAHGMREFMLINDRLSTLLTPLEDKITIVQRSQNVIPFWRR